MRFCGALVATLVFAAGAPAAGAARAHQPKPHYAVRSRAPASVQSNRPFTVAISGFASTGSRLIVVSDTRPCARSGSAEAHRTGVSDVVRRVRHRFGFRVLRFRSSASSRTQYICAYLGTLTGGLKARATTAIRVLLPTTWTVRRGVSPSGLDGISCPSASLCVAFNSTTGTVFTSTNPASGASSQWSAKVIAAHREVGSDPVLNQVSCPSSQLCAAVDVYGDVLSSRDPAAGSAARWVTQQIVPNNQDFLTGISCVSDSLCVAVGELGYVYTSHDLGDGATATWTVSNFGFAGSTKVSGFDGVSCAAPSACVGIDSLSGTVATSSNPGASSSWTFQRVSNLVDISCPTSGLCAGIDSDGHAWLTSDAFRAPSANWAAVLVAADPGLDAISCPSAQLCIATSGSSPTIWTSTDPSRLQNAGWSSSAIGIAGNFTGIACASTSFCAIVDDAGDVLSSSNPGGA